VSASGAIADEPTAYLYAIRPDGRLKWKYPGFYGVTPAIGKDGTIYVSAYNEGFYAFRPDGTVKWKYQCAPNFNCISSPAIGKDGTIYVGLSTGVDPSNPNYYLCAFRPDGTVKWQYSTWTNLNSGWGQSDLSSPAIGKDGTVYVGAASWPGLFAVRPDGSKKWWNSLFFYNTTYYVAMCYDSPAIGADGSIYITLHYGNWDYTLFAFTSDGVFKWIQNCVWGTPAIGRDGTIFAGGNWLCAFNPDGSDRPGWAFAYLDQTEYGSPTIGPDGTVYVSTEGCLLAINSTCGGPATNSPWPMFHRDAKHTGRMPSIGTAPLRLLLLNE
jgi:outer membrane protein assembly factor BamB